MDFLGQLSRPLLKAWLKKAAILPCHVGPSEKPCPQSSLDQASPRPQGTFTQGYHDGYADALTQGYIDSLSTDKPTSHEDNQELSSFKIAEGGAHGTYAGGYEAGLDKGYIDGYSIAEERYSTIDNSSSQQ